MAAHHIVAFGDKRAAGAQEILKNFGIGINDAANGVFLPHRERNDKLGAHHRSVHTKRYYLEVDEWLQRARTREEAIAILNDIYQQLKNNTFSYR
jgi:A nuclease family of the HNH/ENDO VII superfamily with conserved AHH